MKIKQRTVGKKIKLVVLIKFRLAETSIAFTLNYNIFMINDFKRFMFQYNKFYLGGYSIDI